MKCLSCQYSTVPDDAHFCPNCGASTTLAARLEIRQDVEENLGNVIGIKTEAIHGDVYGGDIYEVQLYALTGRDRGAEWSRWLKEDTPPYKFLAPYTAQDSALFKGRDTELDGLLRQIGEKQIVFIRGAPGVGKTSLIAAGLVPLLLDNGALVLHIHDPFNPLKAIQKALAASSEQLAISPPVTTSFGDLVKHLVQETQGSLILFFDQFERLADPAIGESSMQRLLDEIESALQFTEAEYLRLIFSIRDQALGRLDSSRAWVSDGLRAPFKLAPFDYEQAKAAIEGPLEELHYPVSFVGKLVPEILLPDLDDLSPDHSGQILPDQLQIVCHGLYLASRDRHPPHIDHKLYFELKGAEGILASHIQSSLENRYGTEQLRVQHLISQMISEGKEKWISVSDISSNGGEPNTYQNLLKRLLADRILVRRTRNGSQEFTFANEGLAQIIRRLAGPEVEMAHRAENELERAWSSWLVRENLAGADLLSYLETAGLSTAEDPTRTLLLLRSAVAEDLSPNYWLAQLESAAGRNLIQRLESPSAKGSDDGDQEPERFELAESRRLAARGQVSALLGVDSAGLPPSPEAEHRPYGPVTWSAVAHPDPAVRQTGVLALLAWDGYEATNRLDWALQQGFEGRKRWRRQAEVFGALFNAAPEFQDSTPNLSRLDKFGIWSWRIFRRIRRDRQRMAGLSLGGALGAGLALATLRALIAAVGPSSRSGIQFAINFYWGAILGMFLTLGLLTAEILMLNLEEASSPLSREAHSQKRSLFALKIFLGGVFFWLGHGILIFFNALNPLASIAQPLRGAAALLAGMACALVLAEQPYISLANGLRHWLLRLRTGANLLVSMAVFGAAEYLMMTLVKEPALSIAWSEQFYRAEFLGLLQNLFPAFVQRAPQWPQAMAVIDGLLVGVLLPVGIGIGLHSAAVWLARWRSLAGWKEFRG